LKKRPEKHAVQKLRRLAEDLEVLLKVNVDSPGRLYAN
jgi:hypothetical protein